MTALVRSALLSEKQPRTRRLPVAAGAMIWQGAMVALSGGAAVRAVADPTLRVVGIADGEVDNRLGTTGAATVDVTSGCYLVGNDAADPITLSDIGAPCYVTDDNTVSRTNGASGGGAATKPQAGVVFDVADGGVWLKI